MSNSIQTILRSYKEIYNLDRRIWPTVIIQSIVDSVKPFVNILFSSKLINLLSVDTSFKTAITFIVIAIIINFVLFFLGTFLEEYSQNLRNLLLNKESF